jgi:hypothetical protein
MPKAEMMNANMLPWLRRRTSTSFRIGLRYQLFFAIIFNRKGLGFLSIKSELQEVKYEEQKNDTGYLVDIYFSVVRNCCS